ncbi:cysteine hydrolase family protein [Dubosiella newyorkensis]|jgi:nicotinamidase-related amidase|uniref:cysteine hydrolase family protein n=1 Tax=Dubosiella newyorkensis TaxID=1862672 RepID=UPI0023529FFE|nr:isochorismatase family cysteine hydrolase [Dubosiella newyorkensis]MCI9042014.1 cysteine hydrolase [Dubosiella newyorkensis]
MAKRKQHEEETLRFIELNKPYLFVVDMINGFIKEGALADSTIFPISKPIEALVQRLKDRTLFICDSHSADAVEFRSYPPHCIEKSHEAEVIDELLAYKQDVVYKNSTNTFMAPSFQKRLPDILATSQDLIITGCCTDLCILQFALSLRSYLNEMDLKEHRIIIPEDCVDTYHIEGVHDANFWNEAAIQNMKQNGIEVVRSIEVKQ